MPSYKDENQRFLLTQALVYRQVQVPGLRGMVEALTQILKLWIFSVGLSLVPRSILRFVRVVTLKDNVFSPDA